MRMKNKTWKVKGEVSVKGLSNKIHRIEFDADCVIENDGIGAYEFHGSRGYDHGTDYLIPVDQTTWVVRKGKDGIDRKRKIIDTDKINDEVEKFIDENGSPELDEYMKQEAEAQAKMYEECERMEKEEEEKRKNMITCPVCGGTGQDDPPPGKYHGLCNNCGGDGLVYKIENT